MDKISKRWFSLVNFNAFIHIEQKTKNEQKTLRTFIRYWPRVSMKGEEKWQRMLVISWNSVIYRIISKFSYFLSNSVQLKCSFLNFKMTDFPTFYKIVCRIMEISSIRINLCKKCSQRRLCPNKIKMRSHFNINQLYRLFISVAIVYYDVPRMSAWLFLYVSLYLPHANFLNF